MFPFARMVAALDLPLALRCVACLLGGLANHACARARDFETPPYLYVWAADSAGTADDFLAVVDLRPASSRYTQVIATASSGARGTTPHHTEHEMPAGGILWANGFDGNQSFRFNLLDPEHPSMMGVVAPVESLSHAHSFARLPTGHVVMTFQASAPDHTQPGGIAEFDEDGRLVRWASAKDSAWKDYIRPYSITIVPALDRVVTTSADMQGSPPSRTVQVWRFSDLHLLASIELPPRSAG